MTTTEIENIKKKEVEEKLYRKTLKFVN